MIDEIKDHDEQPLNEIVLPLLNVSRRLPDNSVNPKEVNQQTICITSAGIKTSFAYTKLLDTFENSIIDSDNAFFFGCDYRVPILHGLLDKSFVNKLKMSPSYNEESFSREFLSRWSGSSEDTWFNFEKMLKYRKLKNPETHANFRADSKIFYLLSVDVGRLHDQTVCCVFKVFETELGYRTSLVNIYVLGLTAETKTFYQQAIQLKRIIQQFTPREVVIDINGLGLGYGDELIREQVDEQGIIYPPLGFNNDENYKKVQPKNAPKILYGIKANGPLNSKIHSNAYSRIASGSVVFLINEQDAKARLLATKKGQKMSPENRIKRLMPHEMTSRLFDEMANLRLKKGTTSSDIVLERINPRYPKDKYSAFSYGLWRIKELEEENVKRSKSKVGKRQLVFFTP